MHMCLLLHLTLMTLAIGLNRGISSSVKKVTAVPLLPALPVRPIRCMYATADCTYTMRMIGIKAERLRIERLIVMVLMVMMM